MNREVAQAFVLAGGLGTRLRSVVPHLPKCMAEVAGRPFLEWVVLGAMKQGIRSIVMCTGYRAEAIESYFCDGRKWGIGLSYSREESPLGTGGALRFALELSADQTILVLNGDSFCRFDLQRLSNALEAHSAKAALWLTMVDDCSRYGMVELEPDGFVSGFTEKALQPRPGLINAGVYLIQREVLAAIPVNTATSLERDIFPGISRHGLCGVAGDGPFLDIGTPESFSRADAFIRSVFSS